MIQSALSIASAPSRKLFFKSVLGFTAGVAGYGCFLQYSNYLSQKSVWEERQNNINTFKPTELVGNELRYFPWLKYDQFKNWEYKLVKLTGYFKSQRFFVRRTRDGQDGYLVFAPFVTAIDRTDLPDAGHNPNIEYSIFVNLGWVPLQNKSDVQMLPDPVTPLEAPTNPYLLGTNYITNLINDPNNENYQPLTEITGLVRRGQSCDWLSRRRNWASEGVFTWIDLGYMSRFFRVFNREGASTAYIERVVPSLEDGSETLYPVPATPQNFDKPLNSPSSYFNSSLLFGATSGISAVALLSLLK